jgi:hypothetical protein
MSHVQEAHKSSHKFMHPQPKSFQQHASSPSLPSSCSADNSNIANYATQLKWHRPSIADLSIHTADTQLNKNSANAAATATA